ncbi:hypothetical protein BDZ97DRAFT_1803361 [Flammula alnicola]|nr:hypothetical protein BDZ97DRAFT_1803361 [Flammula alnicola]
MSSHGRSHCICHALRFPALRRRRSFPPSRFADLPSFPNKVYLLSNPICYFLRSRSFLSACLCELRVSMLLISSMTALDFWSLCDDLLCYLSLSVIEFTHVTLKGIERAQENLRGMSVACVRCVLWPSVQGWGSAWISRGENVVLQADRSFIGTSQVD